MQLQLRRFYEDLELKEAVLKYFIQFLETKTIKIVFEKDKSIDEILALPIAKEFIEEAIDHLEIMFKKEEKPIKHEDAR